ncbi:aminopeptidase N [Kocuria sp. cx-116]|uniref:aminopeptidase N n=1 Tax=Kocuria sp. cx-116 TaxID=2771378 RepID=UPI001CC24FD0|nr:aminopeptidase N [Kocuria sp. cx-116]
MVQSSLTRAEATTRAEQIRVASYDVTVDLSGAADPQQTTFGSQVTVRFTAEDGAETFIDFIHDSISLVELNGDELDVDDVVEGSRIRLPELEGANELTVVGRALYSRSGEGLHRYVDPQDGNVYIYTQYEPADCRRVFPVFEQPDLKASFTVTLITPPEWVAASNGEHLTTEPAGTSDVPGAVSHEFAPTERISTYITTILAGPYTRVTDEWQGVDVQGETQSVPLALYCRRALAEHLDSEELFAVTKQGLDFFTELFAFDYPFGKYEQAFVPEYNLGAMENPGLVTLTEDYLFPSGATRTQLAGRANTMLHEMCHMWFGDLVTMTWWDDLWLKESFAEFMGAYASVRATEYDDAWVAFALGRKEWAYRQDQLPTTHPIVADIVDLEAARQNFDGITYAKGASVLKQLVAFVGEEAFIDACRAYFRRFAYGNTSLDDFLTVLDEACEADVRSWANDWLLTTGVPHLDLAVERDDSGAIAAATLTQTSDAPRPHVVAVATYAPGASGNSDNTEDTGQLVLQRSTDVRVDPQQPATDLPELLGDTSPVILTNDRDLTYCLASPGADGLSALADGVHLLADPLARALAHSQVWAAVRDARYDPRAYVHLVAHRGVGEQHSSILTTILDRAQEALESFVPPRLRPPLRTEFLDCLHSAVTGAHAGSDAQLVLMRAFARVAARDASHATTVAKLLSGEQHLPGLELGSQLTWALWSAQTATSHATRPQLERAHAADPSREGRLGYLRALAAIPAEEAKAEAWQAITSGSLSNDELSATMSGFQLATPDLLGTYHGAYFESITPWWGEHSMEIATRMIRGLYPRALHAQAASSAEENPTVVASQSWLDENSTAPGALRRIMTELLDDARRAVKLQAAVLSHLNQ